MSNHQYHPAPNPNAGYGYPPQPPAPRGNGVGVAALVVGIVAIVVSLIPLLGMVAFFLGPVAVILGVIGFFLKNRKKGMAITGVILGVLSIIIAAIWTAALGAGVEAMDKSLNAEQAVEAPANEEASADDATAEKASSEEAAAGEEAAAEKEAKAAFPGALESDVVGKAGDELKLGDVTVTSSALAAGDATFGPSLCSTVSLTNNSDETIDFNAFDWKMQEPGGTILDVGFMGSDNQLSSGQIAPGGTTSGDVCFDSKGAQSGTYVMIYEPLFSFFSDRGAWINER